MEDDQSIQEALKGTITREEKHEDKKVKNKRLIDIVNEASRADEG